jgi:hypothetical protein
VADAVAHPGGDGLDAKVIAVPDRLEQRDASGRHPQAGPAQFLARGRRWGSRHAPHPSPVKANPSRKRMTQVETMFPLNWIDASPPSWIDAC